VFSRLIFIFCCLDLHFYKLGIKYINKKIVIVLQLQRGYTKKEKKKDRNNKLGEGVVLQNYKIHCLKNYVRVFPFLF
jgi:hypothetical protein